MIRTKTIKVKDKTVEGVCIKSPGGEGHPNMLVLACEKGFVMCGYLNLELSASLKDAACVVGGASFDDILANPVKAITPAAEALGVKVGMTGEEACSLLS